MPVAAVTLAIDPTCPAVLNSFNLADCVIATEKPTPSPSSTTSLTIGVAIEGVCIIILVIVIIVLIVMHQKKMASYRSVKNNSLLHTFW